MARTRARVVALAAAASLVLAACGASSGGTAAPSPTTSPTPAADPSPSATPLDAWPGVGEVTTVAARVDAGVAAVAVAPDGALLLTDIGQAPQFGGHRILRLVEGAEAEVWLDDRALEAPSAIAVTEGGDVLVTTFIGGTLLRIGADRAIEVVSAELVAPLGLLLDGATAVVTDCAPGRSSLLTVDLATGATDTLTEDPLLNCPIGIVREPTGGYHVSNGGDGRVLHVAADGTVTQLAQLASGTANRMVRFGDHLLVADNAAHRVVAVSVDDGHVARVVGTGTPGFGDGPAATATLKFPNLVALDGAGGLLVGHSANPRRSNYPSALRRVALPGGAVGDGG